MCVCVCVHSYACLREGGDMRLCLKCIIWIYSIRNIVGIKN